MGSRSSSRCWRWCWSRRRSSTPSRCCPWFVTLGADRASRCSATGWCGWWSGHSLFATAVVTFIVRARMQGIDESLEEAAADLYAPPWRRFTQITLPLMLPAVLAGALISFTLSLDNTIVSAFVQVSGSTPWPVYVLSALRSTLRPEIAAMSTVMLLLTLVSLGLGALVLSRSGDSASGVVKTDGRRRLSRRAVGAAMSAGRNRSRRRRSGGIRAGGLVG
jgi:ABC-type Fe3+ transport system permease subunit